MSLSLNFFIKFKYQFVTQKISKPIQMTLLNIKILDGKKSYELNQIKCESDNNPLT